MRYFWALVILIMLMTGFLIYLDRNVQEINADEDIEDLITDGPPVNEVSKSVIKLVHKMHKDEIKIIKQGSGVIIDSDDNNYYVITNYHNMIKEGFETTNIEAIDYLGRFHDVALVLNPKIDFELISSAYDLSLLAIPKTKSLLVAQIQDKAINAENMVFAVGYPDGVRSISSGVYQLTRHVIGFEHQMLVHSSLINHGSSGGGLFDITGALIGINAAGLYDAENNFIEGYSIPSSKVLEYLDFIKK